MNKRQIKKARNRLYHNVVAAKAQISNVLESIDGWELLDFVRKTKPSDLKTYYDRVLMHTICSGAFQDDTYQSFLMPATRDVMAMGISRKGRLHFLTEPYVYGEEDAA